MVYIDEFLEELPLKGVKMDFFLDMYLNDDTTASTNYVDKTGHSRARAEQVKREIKKVAKQHFERLERG